jgi:hypothetical protein
MATTSRSASPSTPVKGGLCGVARRCLPSAGANRGQAKALMRDRGKALVLVARVKAHFDTDQ